MQGKSVENGREKSIFFTFLLRKASKIHPDWGGHCFFPVSSGGVGSTPVTCNKLSFGGSAFFPSGLTDLQLSKSKILGFKKKSVSIRFHSTDTVCPRNVAYFYIGNITKMMKSLLYLWLSVGVEPTPDPAGRRSEQTCKHRKTIRNSTNIYISASWGKKII